MILMQNEYLTFRIRLLTYLYDFLIPFSKYSTLLVKSRYKSLMVLRIHNINYMFLHYLTTSPTNGRRVNNASHTIVAKPNHLDTKPILYVFTTTMHTHMKVSFTHESHSEKIFFLHMPTQSIL